MLWEQGVDCRGDASTPPIVHCIANNFVIILLGCLLYICGILICLWKESNCCNSMSLTPLEPEINAKYTLLKSWDVNGCPLFYVLRVTYVGGHLIFSESHCASTVVNFQCVRVIGLVSSVWVLGFTCFKVQIPMNSRMKYH
jgi:hypothetical protein